MQSNTQHAMPRAWADRTHRPIQHLLTRAADIAKQLKEAEREFFMQQRQLENIQADSAHSFHAGIETVEGKVLYRAHALRQLIEEQRSIIDQINEWSDQALPQPTSVTMHGALHNGDAELVALFLNDRLTCVSIDTFSVSTHDLYERFARYCAGNGFTSMLAHTFARHVLADGRLKLVRKSVDDHIADYWQKS